MKTWPILVSAFLLVPLREGSGQTGGEWEAKPVLEIRVWRVDLGGGVATDLDWEEILDELDFVMGDNAPAVPREQPRSGKPFLGADTSYIHRQVTWSEPPRPPPPPPASTGPRIDVYSIEHRDPAKFHHLLKRITGEVRETSTTGTVTDYDEGLRMPVRTTVDADTSQLLVTSPGTIPMPAMPAVAPQAAAESLSPSELVPRAPISARMSRLGPIPFDTLAEILAVRGSVAELYERQTKVLEGQSVSYQLPFIHSRIGKAGYTVGVELHILVRQLQEEAWRLDIQPHILSFERSPFTLRMVLEQRARLRAGETVALTHVLDPECSRAATMFDKAPPSCRTMVFITRSSG